MFQAALRCLQHLEDSEAFSPVSARGEAFAATGEEMLAFRAQRFDLRYQDWFRFCFAGCGDLAVGPSEVMTVEQQFLIPGASVIKNGDAIGADYGELLLFKWVEPTDINVAADASRETQESHRGIRDAVA